MARKEGLLALEKLIEKEPDRFIRKGMQLLVDGNEPDVIRETMEIELISKEENDIQAAKVFESMGSYTPNSGHTWSRHGVDPCHGQSGGA